MKQILAVILVGTFAAVATEASADNKFCYWNAEGLPYSKEPLPNTDEAVVPGGPIQALGAMILEAPQLMFESVCGVIDDADLVKPREVYRRWGCSADSSMGQMIEGLASGGVFVSPAMSFLEFASDKYEEEFAPHCALLAGIDPICYRISGGFPKDVERYPQCVEAWPKIKAFGEFYSEIKGRERAVLRELSQKDQSLIESASND